MEFDTGTAIEPGKDVDVDCPIVEHHSSCFHNNTSKEHTEFLSLQDTELPESSKAINEEDEYVANAVQNYFSEEETEVLNRTPNQSIERPLLGENSPTEISLYFDLANHLVQDCIEKAFQKFFAENSCEQSEESECAKTADTSLVWTVQQQQEREEQNKTPVHNTVQSLTQDTECQEHSRTPIHEQETEGDKFCNSSGSLPIFSGNSKHDFITEISPTSPVGQTVNQLQMGSGESMEREAVGGDLQTATQSVATMSGTSRLNSVDHPSTSLSREPSQSKNLISGKSVGLAETSRLHDGYEEAQIRISLDGFSQQDITISEGERIKFVCDSSCSNTATLLQVVYDGEELRPVIGGHQVVLDDHHRVFHQVIHLEGEYKFAVSGLRCTPLTIKVKRSTDFQVKLSDEGFTPDIINIYRGGTVHWSWKQTAMPHTVTEVNYVLDKGCISRQVTNQSLIASTTGTHRHTFNRAGVYYFRTEGSSPGTFHVCVVCVQAVCKEYRIEVLDRSFQPMILLIEEGDRVWFSWDRTKCKKSHSVYQIEPPTIDHGSDDVYEPVQDGFKWTKPSKQGLMAHRFNKAGVFYFSDQNFEEAAEYIGTIIVKPKQTEHFVRVTESRFSPDLIWIKTGDQIWWMWDGPARIEASKHFLLLEEDKVLNPLSRKSSAESSEHLQELDASSVQLFTKAGQASIHLTSVGLYTYKSSDSSNTCTVLVNPGSKNYTIHLTDSGIEPKVSTINCNDRVWWVWQSGRKEHNIIQVSHQGQPIPDGFCSGQPRECPSAFVHQFCTPGVFYFMSKTFPQIFGAIVVATRPQVHEVSVAGQVINPDPVTVQLNDIVAWVFDSPQQYGVVLVEGVDQVLDAGSNVKAVVPRRSFAKSIAQTGIVHFKSKSFQKKKDSNVMDEIRLSSVLCDDRTDNILVQVNKKGFHPNTICLQKGQSLLWNWNGTDEEHNIIHVTDPNSAWILLGENQHATYMTPLNMIKGSHAFNSGRTLSNDSFLYTFDEVGSYTVISQGAPGYSCTVNVMEVAQRTSEPYISSEVKGGTVDRFTKLRLASSTSGAKIYYTLDGSHPSTASKLYSQEREVVLRKSGLSFVRAIAIADGYLQSYIFTSKRFWVLSKGDEDENSEDSAMSDKDIKAPLKTKAWDWYNCKPTIKGCFTLPGTMEVFWDPPESLALKEIKAYQILLNGVSYCQRLPPSTNSLKLVGLAGGRRYKVLLKVYPKNSKNQVLESNVLQMTCPKLVPSGGPVISLETSSDPRTLSAVWMSIDSAEVPVDGYIVYLNDKQCGPKLVPEAESNRCKVVISGCDTNVEYKLFVEAILSESDKTCMSNVLMVQLPLDVANIVLPPSEQRVTDEGVYQEYVEVLEGSGYLPQMDEDARQQSAPNKVVEVEDGGSDDNEKMTSGSKHRSSSRFSDSAKEDSGTSSESDSDSSEVDSQRPHGGHAVILDASKNRATDTRESLQKKAVRDPNKDQDSDIDSMARIGDDRKRKKKHHDKSAVRIEVEKTVELDMSDNQMKEKGDISKTKHKHYPEEKIRVEVKEGELVHGDNTGLLPAPSISATAKGQNGVRIAWELPRKLDPQYKLALFVINVVGTKFSSEINSDISYECNIVEKGKQVRGVQHCWNIQEGWHCSVKGLQPGLTYRIYVIANYSTVHGNKPCEVQTTSSVLYFTTMGQPKAPVMRIVRVGLYQVTLAWDVPDMPDNAQLSGYQIIVDGKPLGGLRNSDIQQMVINNLAPGKTLSVNVVTVVGRAMQESAPSKTIHITCPSRPPAPIITQQPSYKKGCVLIAWDKPQGYVDSNQKSISGYSIYVDGQGHGEIKVSSMSDKQGYQFFLTDLLPEQSYDVSVKSIAADKYFDPDSQHVYCLCESFMSNVVPVMAPAAPKSPKLRLEGLHPGGIDVTWQTPQQSGDAHISGYQMLKNGKLYGSIIPPDVNSLRIRDISFGEKLTLQLIALTEHPVGKGDGHLPSSGSTVGDKDSGIGGSTVHQEDRATALPATGRESQKIITFTQHVRANDWPTSFGDVFVGDRYSGCKPGPKLVVHYTGLVAPPTDVRCEQLTGHSALIAWKKAEERKAHFVHADSYQVTWWPGDRPEDEINSDSTTDDHLLINNLRPATAYTIVVEARKMEKYTDVDEGVTPAETPEGLNAFILSSKSEHLIIRTASPPDPPNNVGLAGTTCSSLRLAWDPPQEHGSEVIAIRIECISLNTQDPHHVTEDVMPDAISADILGLHDKTDYLVRVIAVTEEYFNRLPDNHRHKKLHAIPKDVLIAQEESSWLPSTSIIAKTAGTEAPANIRLTKATTTYLTLTWIPPLVYGSNKLLSQIVRWRNVRQTKPNYPEDLIVASHVSLMPMDDTLTINDLVPGSQYQVIIEAVVSVKTSLNPDQSHAGIEKFRRTAHVMSKPVHVWTRAPVESPKVLLTSYNQSSANLYWEKPLLVSIIGKDADGNPRYLRRYLEGYRLEINGKLQSCLGPAAQTCTLTKCKPGKQYGVILVAMTCTEERRRQRKEKFKGYFKTISPQEIDYVGLLEDDLLDQAPSEPVEVTLPLTQDGFIESLEASFVMAVEQDNRSFGSIEVKWIIQGQSKVLKQFSIVWFSYEDRIIQTKFVGPEKTCCTIPVTHLKSVYNISVEPCYYTEVLPQQPQDIQIMVPGPPDAPKIFLCSQDAEEFVIEWGEPKMYGGVKVRGYQIYLNDKKTGNELNSSHRKAIIPCRANKSYRIHLVALSSNPDFPHSPNSNTLLISSGQGEDSHRSFEEHASVAEDQNLPVKITNVTQTGIHLDWSSFVDNQDVAFFKIQWSSVAQPTQREVRLSPKDVSCVINKCLPGTSHFVRLLAFNESGQIVEKSKQLTVQTSAPPDTPVLSVRACNFRYIAVQWEKPTTYGDALIIGYKVFINGIVEAVLGVESLSYTFTQGKWCQEYSFQVQALTAGDHMNSKPSEPLVLTWPGAKVSSICRMPSISSSSIRVSWDDPYLTDGVKIKHYKLCCIEEGTEKLVDSIAPIHPDSREAEFKDLQKGSYNVYLEAHLYGTGEIVRSDIIRTMPALSPDPPQISVTVVGLEERRQLEKLACDLANKRDRLIRAVGHKLKRIGALAHPLRAEKDDDVVKGAHTLTGVEELLESCFTALENYTGQLIAHISWQCPQSSSDIQLSGFKVLVDSKQYGSSLHGGARTVRLQLGLEEASYKLSMVSLSDKPQGSSVESSVVELLSAPFRPFSYYCYHNIHSKAVRWPSQGCCKYQDSLIYERQVGKKLANQGLLSKHVPPPACNLFDVFAGDYKSLMANHQPQRSTILLFWTPWCLSSQKIMDHFVRFAREASREFNFIAVACGVPCAAGAERQSLIHNLTSSGWREDGIIWQCTSECSSAYRTRTSSSSLRLDPDLVSEKFMDLTELLGIAGVPTFIVIHPEGYIAWHGRYSAFDYASFSAFLRHTNSEVLHQPCPVFNCDCCKNDTSINQDMISILLAEKSRNQVHPVIIKDASPDGSEVNLSGSPPHMKNVFVNGFTENAVGSDKILAAHKPSPKLKSKLSINKRPYSASSSQMNSPYLAKVVPEHAQPSRSSKRPVSAKLVHYM